mmetsp:Transcript_9454/g.20527  ORF Transcript_9454/g.20527 Transcript_9454/m.20527 type:complete len:197 (-) Transcript_9454:269-859(-)
MQAKDMQLEELAQMSIPKQGSGRNSFIVGMVLRKNHEDRFWRGIHLGVLWQLCQKQLRQLTHRPRGSDWVDVPLVGSFVGFFFFLLLLLLLPPPSPPSSFLTGGAAAPFKGHAWSMRIQELTRLAGNNSISSMPRNPRPEQRSKKVTGPLLGSNLSISLLTNSMTGIASRASLIKVEQPSLDSRAQRCPGKVDLHL